MQSHMQSHIESVLDRHERIAFQFSGGRDSIACLYLLRPYLDRITVYRLNTRVPFPETQEIIAQLRPLCPHYVEVDGNQPGVIEQFGLPSDIVPASHTPLGLMAVEGARPLIQDKYACCANTVMLPMHYRMQQDGITLVIRGQKNADHHKATIRSGHVEQGIEYLFPIEDWSTQQVMDYLRAEGAPVSRVYEMMSTTSECITCSAWWEDGAAAYLKRYHPEAHAEVQRRLDIINEAIAPHIQNFNNEVNA